MIRRDEGRKLGWVTIAVVCLTSAAACTARDDAPAGDSAASVDTSAASGDRVTTPDPLPPVTDTVVLPGTAPRDMPPVAGETKKPIDDPRERDSVVEPRFEVGEDGKVRPIKR